MALVVQPVVFPVLVLIRFSPPEYALIFRVGWKIFLGKVASEYSTISCTLTEKDIGVVFLCGSADAEPAQYRPLRRWAYAENVPAVDRAVPSFFGPKDMLRLCRTAKYLVCFQIEGAPCHPDFLPELFDLAPTLELHYRSCYVPEWSPFVQAQIDQDDEISEIDTLVSDLGSDATSSGSVDEDEDEGDERYSESSEGERSDEEIAAEMGEFAEAAETEENLEDVSSDDEVQQGEERPMNEGAGATSEAASGPMHGLNPKAIKRNALLFHIDAVFSPRYRLITRFRMQLRPRHTSVEAVLNAQMLVRRVREQYRSASSRLNTPSLWLVHPEIDETERLNAFWRHVRESLAARIEIVRAKELNSSLYFI